MRENRFEIHRAPASDTGSEKKPADQTLTLPEGRTADELLNDLSVREREKIALAQGLTLEAFDRHLAVLARRERVSQSITAARAHIDADRREDKSEYAKEAQEAVLRGIRLAIVNDPYLVSAYKRTPSEEEYIFDRAYEELSQSEKEENPHKNKILRESAAQLFEWVVRSRSIREITDLLQQGATFDESYKRMGTLLKERAVQQNILELKWAYEKVSELMLTKQFFEKAEVGMRALASYSEGQDLDPELKILMGNLVKAAKASYIKGRVTDEILKRYGVEKYSKFMADIVSGYAKYGPHKRTAENVSGPTEVYGSIQSRDRNSGYNRTGKRRPHRGAPGDDRS